MFAAIAPWIQSFARVESERDSLQSTSSELASKHFAKNLYLLFEFMPCNQECVCEFYAEGKQSAEERVTSLEQQVKDLQDKLASQQSESEKALKDAQEATTRRDKDLVARLSCLIHDTKGELLVLLRFPNL